MRRRFMGHRAGDDVFGRIYTLDHPEVAPLAKVAAILDDNIAMTIGTLLTPTTAAGELGHGQPDRGRADYVNATLGGGGLARRPRHRRTTLSATPNGWQPNSTSTGPRPGAGCPTARCPRSSSPTLRACPAALPA